MQLTYGSLFSGIGGFDLGFDRSGMRCVWQVEIDDYANRVLETHWPNVPRWRDVRTFPQPGFERPDVICGGFPCTDISNAGNMVGIEGERSGLWADFARIVCVLRPRFVVVENVASLSVRGFGRVVGDLAGHGYNSEWAGIPSAAFGSPHIRRRMFIVAQDARMDFVPVLREFPLHDSQETRARLRMPGGIGVAGESLFNRDDGTDADADGERLEEFDASTVASKVGQRAWMVDTAGNHWRTEPGVDRVGSGIPCRVDRLRCLGNVVVPQVSQWIAERIIAAVR